MDFDRIVDRRGTHCRKWDSMQDRYGVSPDDGIPMWIADMDFAAPDCVRRALQRMVDHGVHGYFGDDAAYLRAIRWWQATRHGLDIPPEAIFTTHGLVNGAALAIHTWTRPGDGVVLFTPVYHVFAQVIRAAGREVVECPLRLEDGRHVMDLGARDLPANARMVLFCSPHNPGGRVWSVEEQRALADWAVRHDLVVVSDEIHNDLVMPGHTHVPMAVAAPELADRLVTMTATTKTFNIAGAHTGNVIVHDPARRAAFARSVTAMGISPNAFGLHMATAACSPEGAEWVDALVAYLDGNRRLFDEGMAAIPGVRSMPLEATYLAWVDFSGTGMEPAEVTARVERQARIAVNHGPSFGTGGEGWLRFNLATPRVRVAEAVARLQDAFADLQ